MFEILLVIIAAGGIAAFARGRGGRPWLWGGIAVAGFVAVVFVVGPALLLSLGLAGEAGYPWLADVAGWAWVASVALYARFGLAHDRPGPGQRWSCPNCHFLNQKYAVVCEACKEPWSGGQEEKGRGVASSSQ